MRSLEHTAALSVYGINGEYVTVGGSGMNRDLDIKTKAWVPENA